MTRTILKLVAPATEESIAAIYEAAQRKYKVDPDEGVDLGASDVLSLIARIEELEKLLTWMHLQGH